MDWQTKALQMKKNQKSIAKIATTTGKTPQEIAEFLGVKKFNKSVESKPTNTKYTFSNNSHTYEDIVEITAGKEITPEIIMAAHKLLPNDWVVVSFTSNVWQSQTKEGTTVDLCQSKLTVKPKATSDITYEDISRYFSANKWEKIKIPEPMQYDESGETLEVTITDLHSGLLSWREETGADYDLKIMRKNFENCVADLKYRCQGRKFKKIIIASLGDIIHIDNNNQTTTKGTVQQAEGRVEKIIDYTFDTFISIFSIFGEMAPIEYIYLKGNHDELTGFMFVFALKQFFSENKNITFDIKANPNKARLIGKSLIGFEHGVESKQKEGGWLVNDHRELFGKCLYSEIHSGHLHSQQTDEKNFGVVVRRLPLMCNASAWEHISGYRAYKGMICFVWHDELLLREQWFNFF